MSLILAIDKPLNKIEDLVRRMCSRVKGFKLGLPLLLHYSPSIACRLRRHCPSALWIADLKLADIGSTMRLTASAVAGCADAIIAHAVVGIKGGLQELKDYLDAIGVKLILVIAMSHPGAEEAYNTLLNTNIEIAKKLGVWGVVAPATKPEYIKLAREELGGDIAILAPGVGAQGAKPGSALCAGADYEIVGRAITEADNPISALESIIQQQKRAVELCRSVR